MKTLLLIIALTLSFSVNAQKDIRLNKTFLRVYDLQGKKIGKGKIVSLSETTLLLNKNRRLVAITVTNIGSIKTKSAEGRNILIGAAIGIPAGALVGQAQYKGGFLSFPRRTYAAIGATVGIPAGAFAGAISTAFKVSKTYKINGDPKEWKVFSEAVLIN